MNVRVIAAVLLCLTSNLFGHPGNTDSSGGHTNRKTGEYHYHGTANRTGGGKTGYNGGSRSGSSFAPVYRTPFYTARPTAYQSNPTPPPPVPTPYVPPAPTPTPLPGVSNAEAFQEWVLIDKAVDGDTIKTATGATIRLIGVNTPETVDPRKPVQYFGKEASAFTSKLVTGKRARLEYDQERTDKYGRVLAYVYLEDGTFVNQELITQGYANAYIKYPFQYMERFRACEREAREAGRGLWAADAGPTPAARQLAAGTVFVTEAGQKFHSAGCVYGSKGKPVPRVDAVSRGFEPCSRCNP